MSITLHLEFIEGKPKITLCNVSSDPVMLMKAGDGSTARMRVPSTSFEILDSKGKMVPPPYLQGRCGVINPYTKDQFFTLKPGEEEEISRWYLFPTLKPGSYKVKAVYDTTLGSSRAQGVLTDEKGEIGKLYAQTHKERIISKETALTLDEKHKP